MISGYEILAMKRESRRWIRLWIYVIYVSPSRPILAHEKYKWNKKKSKSLVHLQQPLAGTVKAFSAAS